MHRQNNAQILAIQDVQISDLRVEYGDTRLIPLQVESPSLSLPSNSPPRIQTSSVSHPLQYPLPWRSNVT